MQLTILNVILWPKDSRHTPRVIPFEQDRLNVLTGESATGKSTITSVIDYCLGSSKCAIPVGLIREVTEWFGLHLKLANTEMIVARRNPGEQQSTTDLFWMEGLKIEVPKSIERNARVEDLKNRFNIISHLPQLDFSRDEQIGFGSRASFRDMSAFTFQPQHIVANPYTLFFKADTTEHREKLKIIFPLVLGAIDSDDLARQRELKDLRREYDKQKRELDARLSAASAWEAEIGGYYLQAKALGLLQDSPSPEANWPLDKYILELQRVPSKMRQLDIPDIKEGTNEEAALELTKLIEEEDRIGQELSTARRRLDKLSHLNSSVGAYSNTLTGQEDRMVGAGWFEEAVSDSHRCPVCLAMHDEPNAHLNELKELAGELKLLTTAVYQAPVKLDEEVAVLRKELRAYETQISKARQKRKFLEGASEELTAQRQRVRDIYLFVGRVEQALENVSTSRNVDELRDKVEGLNQRIAALQQLLDPSAQKNRLDAAMASVSKGIARYAELLKLEHSNEPIGLYIPELTLQFTPLSGRKDFLWEVGSGQNWVGYHIAALLALHEHFALQKNSPVPRLLVIDQPSQVYFPEAWPDIKQVPASRPAHNVSADIEGVRRIFAALSHFLERVKGTFQIIVTEHAGEITWKGLSNVNLVGNWRIGKDEFLVPKSWLEGRSSN